MARGVIFLLFIAFALTGVRADWGWGGHGGGGWHGDGDGNGDTWWDGSSDDGDSDTTPSVLGAQILGSTSAYNRYNSILIAHAVLASLVWVVFVPWAALLLRVGIKSGIVLKLHVALQVSSECLTSSTVTDSAKLLSLGLFVVAAGLGIWLARTFPNVWNDAHTRLGLAVLALALLQPVFGTLHHRLSKRRAADATAGRAIKSPGRTSFGRIHIWLGRSLILMGIVNGGLGIRLAGKSPLQSSSTTTKAATAYGVVAGGMFALYFILVVLFEIRRRRAHSRTTAPQQTQLEKLPTYDESESSLSQGPARYQ